MDDARRGSGRVALVTGASEGIGKAIAARLHGEGWRVAMLARPSPVLDDAVAGLGQGAHGVACDLREPEQIVRAVEQTVRWGGGLDALVNCASAGGFGATLSIPDEEWVAAFEVKVFGGLRMMRAAWPHLAAARGAVVNICGIGARMPRDETALTGALSASLLALTKSFADRGVADGVWVNAINPGPVLTPRLAGMLEARAAASGSSLEEAIAAMERDNRITRLGRPEDVAALAAFLLGPDAELLQGAIIDLDGGMTKAL
jgi:3-oxoacyl-[acyl-carrier protein] reductase